MTNKIDTVLKAITDRIRGALPSDTVKNPKLNLNPIFSVLSARSYPTDDPQCSTQIHGSINTISICPKWSGEPQTSMPKEEEQDKKENLENINTNHSSPPDPSVSFITKKVRDDGDIMFLEIIKKNDDSHKEEPEVGENTGVGELEVEYFNVFLTRSELSYHRYLMCGSIPLIFPRSPIIIEGCPSNLKIPCNIGHVHIEKAYIDLNLPLNIITRMMYNWNMKRKHDPRKNTNGGVNNFTGAIKGMNVFVGNFIYVIDFMIVEDISSIINPRLSQVVLRKPFVEVSNMTHDPPEGVVRFTNRTDKIAYKMPHKIEQYNSLLDLERECTKLVYLRNEEDKRRGLKYVMSKILGFYKECLELGTEYATRIDDEGETTSINTIKIFPKRSSESQTDKPEEEEQGKKDNPENINTNPNSPPDPSVSFITKKVRDDDDMMFIKIIKKNDDSHKEEPEVDFMIVEYISSIIDPRVSQAVLRKPFVEISNMTHDPPEGIVRFINETYEIAYKMPYKLEQYNSLSDLERKHTKSVYLRNEEDKIRGVEYVMSKILRFYKECLELGPEYATVIADEREVTYGRVTLSLDTRLNNKEKRSLGVVFVFDYRLYLMRRSLEVIRKFHYTILGERFNQLSNVSSPLLSKPGEY
nr:retrotransposon Orf1 [Tanacetum cinerariifolium]